MERGSVLYIHGFGSCGDSNKSRLLKAHFGEECIVAPDLPADPDDEIAMLEHLIRTHPVTLLVGSSLGGYYAEWLAQKYKIAAVLVNPSTRPFETLAPYVGTNRRWCDGKPFEWKGDYLAVLRRYDVDNPGTDVKRLVLLQSGDEVLDYRLAAEKYKAFDVVVQEGGNHRFENLADYLAGIADVYRSQAEASQ